MPVIRVEKDNNYVSMGRFHLKDKRISLKAKGLMSVVLSLSPNWNYSIKGLCAICKESQTAVTNAIKELQDYGYAKIIKHYPKKDERTTIEYEYVFYEKPLLAQDGGNQDIENLCLDDVHLDNVSNINNNKLNNKQLSPASDSQKAPEKKSKKKPIYDHTSIPYRAAKWLSEQIMERLPEQKAYTESDLQRWADDFRLMNTADGYEWELIEKVLQYSQEDYFWSQNILSASKFRKQFSTLLAKAKASGYV